MADTLTTQQALDLIQQMQSQISGPITTQVQALQRHGQTLSDPNNFAGGSATQARAAITDANTVVHKAVKDLTELRQELDKAHKNIVEAGGGLGS
jgi:chromosome segregation ATPase